MREFSLGGPLDLEPNLPERLLTSLTGLGPQRALCRKETLYAQGDAAAHVFLLLKGRVKSTLVGPGGQESILRIHLPHSILGLTALGSRPVRDASAIALDSALVVSISRKIVLRAMRTEPDLHIYLVRLLIDRMSDFHHRVGELMVRPVIQRLARALVVLSTPDPSTNRTEATEIPLTHEELAQLINARRPTVSAILSRFAEKGLVAKSGRHLYVRDRLGLLRFAATTEPIEGECQRADR